MPMARGNVEVVFQIVGGHAERVGGGRETARRKNQQESAATDEGPDVEHGAKVSPNGPAKSKATGAQSWGSKRAEGGNFLQKQRGLFRVQACSGITKRTRPSVR